MPRGNFWHVFERLLKKDHPGGWKLVNGRKGLNSPLLSRQETHETTFFWKRFVLFLMRNWLFEGYGWCWGRKTIQSLVVSTATHLEKIFASEKKLDRIPPKFRGEHSNKILETTQDWMMWIYTWYPKQPVLKGCLVISNHFLYKDLESSNWNNHL